MRHNLTLLEGKNEPIIFSHSVLGNYFIELESRNYQSKDADNGSDKYPELLQLLWDDKIDCNIVSLDPDVESRNISV